MIDWLRSWWITWRVWRHADAEQRRILTSPLNPEDYVEAPRPPLTPGSPAWWQS